MDLKDFVAETLKQIIDGVAEAGDYYAERGGSINSRSLRYRNTEGSQLVHQQKGQMGQLIEFDVALTAVEGTEIKGGIGVFVGAIGLGSQGKSDTSNTSVSRVKFAVPVLLPQRRRSVEKEDRVSARTGNRHIQESTESREGTEARIR